MSTWEGCNSGNWLCNRDGGVKGLVGAAEAAAGLGTVGMQPVPHVAGVADMGHGFAPRGVHVLLFTFALFCSLLQGQLVVPPDFLEFQRFLRYNGSTGGMQHQLVGVGLQEQKQQEGELKTVHGGVKGHTEPVEVLGVLILVGRTRGERVPVPLEIRDPPAEAERIKDTDGLVGLCATLLSFR